MGVLSKNKEAVNAFDGGNIGEYTDSSFTYIKTRAFKLNMADIEQNTKRLDSFPHLKVFLCDHIPPAHYNSNPFLQYH